MRKVSFIILTLFIFLLSYQVRSSFLQTKDYNEPADASEYRGASANAATSIRKYLDGEIKFNEAYPWLIGALDAHNSPVVNGINTIIALNFPEARELAILIFSSIFVVLFFYVARLFFPFWISFSLALIAAVYTPLYAFNYSFMLESFGSFVVPTLTFVAVYFSFRSSRSIRFSFLTGLFLALIALYRIEFRWIGIPFVVIWFLSFGRKHFISSLVMFFTYLILTVGWMIIARVAGGGSYYQLEGNVMMVLYNAYNYPTYGWMFDTAPIRTFSQVFTHMLDQGPFHLIWLQLAQMVRLWMRPATMYIGEYPMPDAFLFSLHYLILLLAIFGLRKIFFSRTFLFLAVPLLWATAFSYNPEELRRQIPLVATVILFMGAGLEELKNLYLQKKFRYIVLTLSIFISLLLLDYSGIIYGFLSWFYPQILPISFLRFAVLGIEFILILIATAGLIRLDSKKTMLFGQRHIKMIPAFIPLCVFIIVLSYQSKNFLWYQWKTNLLPFHKIEQKITLGSNELRGVKSKEGYLLIDIKDADSGKNLDVTLNRVPMKDTLSLKQSFSSIDLLVLRQFQRGMPRLGFGHVEDEVASLSALPNVHQWLIYKVDGKLLKEKNIIDVKNKGYTYKNSYIYGDYASGNIYRGPTAQVFQGPISFYKYQVDQDIRLIRQSNLNSTKNKSILLDSEGRSISDLSNQFGLQRGRYRIFLLFPYLGGDPNDVF